jgi:hypothetical protein
MCKLLVLVAVGCGASPARSSVAAAPAPDTDRSSPERLAAAHKKDDAPKPPPGPVEPSAPAANRDGKTVGQILGAGDVEKDSSPDTDRTSAKRLAEAHQDDNFDAPPDDGRHIENGVTVVDIAKPAWCVTSGDGAGSCWPTAAVCAARAGRACQKKTAWACFSLTERTSAKEGALCLVDYGLCSKAAAVIERNPEYTDVSACWIYRVVVAPKKK